MSLRKSDMLWLRDLVEHLGTSAAQLEWSQDASSVHYLTDTMIRDLDCCRRLLQTLHHRAAMQSMN